MDLRRSHRHAEDDGKQAKRDEEENIEYPRQHEAQQVESRAHGDESTWRRKR